MESGLTSDAMPTGNITDLAFLRHEGTKPFLVYTEYTPIFTIYYSDGSIQGQGYIGASIASPRSINGSGYKVRSNFTVSGPNKIINKVSLRLKKISGTDALTVRLEDSGGTLIEQGTIAAANILTTMTWVTCIFLTSHVLSSGSTYHLVLNTASGSTYQTYALQDGSKEYGYIPMFSDGCFQYTTNGSTWNYENDSNYKAQIYFSNQTVSVTSISVTGAGGTNTITTNKGTLQVVSSVSPSDAANKTVKWSIANVTGRATISATGIVSAIGNGTVMVTATATDGSGVYGTFLINISNQVIPVASIVLTGVGGAVTITSYNGTLQLIAAVSPSDATNKTLTWSISNGTDQATISSSGLITAVSNGTVTAKASATDGSGVYGTLFIAITNQANPVSKSYKVPEVLIYPNPAHEFVNIRIVEPTLVPDFLRIINLSGKVVFQNKVKPDSRDFQIPINLVRGVYIVVMGSVNLIQFTQKLIVE
jgi:uncharacterized protein YjdB